MLHDLCHCKLKQMSGDISNEEENRMNEASGGLTQSQHDTLTKFREILSEQGLLRKRDDDHTLLRFLRARGFDIPKAKAMFEVMLEWRAEIGADTIRETFEFPERKAVRDLYPHFHHKTDKLGRPVYIERLGQLNVDELLKLTTMDRMLLYHVKEWEVLLNSKFPACSEKAGTCVSQSLAILDLKGVNMKHMSKQVRHFIQKITKVDQDYYPECLGKMFIVNAPTAFKAMWAVIKPWLDKRTQKKIELHGGHFSSRLLELVDCENLPEFLGGSCNCLGGCENSDAGPWNEAPNCSDALYDEPCNADE
ncbi:phosphatidylinositol/phosphatidylcholine transfer protein SFH1 [Physcomitrium patens]|nr:phosphatidylinositol/phosphatidylcholine transfer protein SFH1-like [Physcomitrium patens]|eukprot:XP_024396611.1 phosphatidylinositol/phosphatidylcholine transfer protein SFH1-like [Physcomitrella patens]